MPVRPSGFEQVVYVVTTLSSTTAPSAAQINAGVAIKGDLPAPINFSATQNYIDSSPLQQQDEQQAGTISIDNLEFEIYRWKTSSQTAYDSLPNGATRYLVKFEGGGMAGATAAAGDICDIATVVVGIKTDVPAPRNDTRRWKVPVAVTATINWRSVCAA